MYIIKIKNNDDVMHEIHGINEKLKTGSVVKGINTIDSFSFSMLPSNQCFNLIKNLKTLISVYNTNKKRYEFHGRVLYSSASMDSNGLISKEVICESYLGFLCDTLQDYVAEKNWTVDELLEHIIRVHNSKVGDEHYKKFRIGNVNVTDPNDNLYLGIQIDNTWNVIQEKLIGKLGGEITFRVVGDVIYLDYLTEIGSKKENPIKMSKNMKAITRENNPVDCVSRLVPYGCKLTDADGNETEERLDITSVNDGKDYIDDIDAIEAYGIRYGTVTFEDVTVASNLLTKAKRHLKECSKVQVKYSVEALDLSLLGLDISDFTVGNYHPVINPLLGIDDTVRVIKQNIDVCEEIKSTIEVGDNFKNATTIQLEQAGQIKNALQTVRRVETAAKKLEQKAGSLNEKLNAMEGNISTALTETQLAASEAQAAAERAQLDATEAVTAAQGAANAANEAKTQASNANTAAQSAIGAANNASQQAQEAKQAATDAHDKSVAVEENLTDLNDEIDTVKEDAVKMREDLESELETYKTTASQIFSTKTETAAIETTLRQEYQESIAGIQSTFSQDYAKKSDLSDAIVEAKESLQTQITQNANTIALTAKSVEDIQIDITSQDGKIAAAQKAASDAQTIANQAKTDAQDAQDAADAAKTQATNANIAATNAQTAASDAQLKANTATRELAEAKADLATAEAKLAEVEGSANANAEDIAAAQKAVQDAQAAVQTAQGAADKAKADAAAAQTTADQAKKDAADANTAAGNAQTKANEAKTAADNAQSAADEAKADLAALESRVVTAETTIEQHAEAIALRATKSEVTALTNRVSAAEQKITADAIISTVSETFISKADAGSTYATKSEVTQTASGLEVKITTAQSTADTAKSNAATAQTTANNAAKTATNFMGYDATNGLLIGNKSSGSWSGNRAQILPTSFNILDSSGTTLSSFGANEISLANNNEYAHIYMCGKAADIHVKQIGSNDFFNIYSENISIVGENNMYFEVDAETEQDPYCGIKILTASGTSSRSASMDIKAEAPMIIDGSALASYAKILLDADSNNNPFLSLTIVDPSRGTEDKISIVPDSITLKSKSITANGKLTVTGDTITEDVKVNGKTVNDTKEGIYLSAAGYMQIQRTSDVPYVDFIYGSGQSSKGRIGVNSSSVMTFANSTAYSFDSDVCVGGKTYNDGKAGIFLDSEGFMQIQRNNSSYHPYIAFYLNGNAGTTSDGQMRVNQSSGYMEFMQADRYTFDNRVDAVSVYVNQGLRIGEDANVTASRAIGTYWKDNAVHYIVERSSDGLTSAFGWAGSASYATISKIRGRTCQVQNASGTSALSDERLKKDFTELEAWDAFYDALEPCAFRMKTGNSGRYHMGFKAQQVEQALLDAGLTTNDFAGFVRMPYLPDEDDPEGCEVYAEAGINAGDDELGLIYSEFTALNTYQIQQLKKENAGLKDEIAGLKKLIEQLLPI